MRPAGTMMKVRAADIPTETNESRPLQIGTDHWRFHRPHAHLATPFGTDWFARQAETFARFFGTPLFLFGHTIVVVIWIGVNMSGLTRFDLYPFILLNLAFSLQAAYAAPLILLAQARQALRDKVHAEADALHREELAAANEQRMLIAAQNAAQMLTLLKQNTDLTELSKQLAERIELLATEMHHKFIGDNRAA